MTAPVEASNPPILVRRVGPFPVWVWFLAFVVLLAGFLWWRKRTKGNADSGMSSTVNLSGGVTQTAPSMIPYTSDIFVTVNRPEPGADAPAPPSPPTTTPENPRNDPPATNTPPSSPTPPPRQTTVSYTVKPNDTLSKIGGQYNVPWQSIYAANQSLIESVAKQHGWPNSNNGHWIFPGTTLMIPV